MMEDYKKAQYFLANYHALSTAAEMIRSHGEEGFAYDDKGFDKAYKRETKKLAKQLDSRANDFAKKYQAMNIHISTDADENY